MKKFKRAYPPRDSADIAPDALCKVVKEPKAPRLQCQFHFGELKAKEWTCCGGNVSAEPCAGFPDHIPESFPQDSEIERLWQYHATPIPEAGSVCHPHPVKACWQILET
jgi:hypothetical protein